MADKNVCSTLMSAADRDKWNARYATEAPPREPSAVLTGLAHLLPASGRAIDVAGGGGRHAIWLAQRGLDVTLADISHAALAVARQRAADVGVALRTLEIDVEQEPFPTGPWDLILTVCYFRRPLFEAFPRVLAPGGLLVVIQPTVTNLERHPKPPRDYLLEDGELRKLVRGLELIYDEEGWLADGRHDAVIVGRRT